MSARDGLFLERRRERSGKYTGCRSVERYGVLGAVALVLERLPKRHALPSGVRVAAVVRLLRLSRAWAAL